MTATVEAGRVVEVAPDPSRYPYDKKIMNGCSRWPIAPEIMDHPNRVNYPLKRKGERGGGQWERVSWEQAMGEISQKLRKLEEQFGPQTLATNIGGPHTTYWPLHRFMTLFGSPNNMGIGQICWNPGVLVNTITYGWQIDMELAPEWTECALLWGVNPAESDNSLFWRTVLDYKRTGKPLIVVDPRRTRTAEQATLWLPIRPGTDIWLALGLLHVIIMEKLYDESFVISWCHGFDELSHHILPYTPQRAARETGLDAEQITQAARIFAANSPSSLYSGRGIDQLGPNSFPTHRALAALRAITGNLDVPGASHIGGMPDFIPELDLELSERMPESVKAWQLGVYDRSDGKLLVHSYDTYKRIQADTMKHGKRLPMRYLTSAHPNLVWRAMLSGEPYPIRALIVMASNPLLTQANTQLIYQAMKSLDLMVVLEQFHTPTSMMADYVLPCAGIMERPLLETKAGTANIAYGGEAAVEPYYERRADYFFWKELGLRLGHSKSDWPWETYREALAASMESSAMDWEKFCLTGIYDQPPRYWKQDEIDNKTGNPAGFATSSGKVELFSGLLEQLGADPLPTPKPSPKIDNEFPLLLISGARFQPYYASSFHQVEKFRIRHPEPLAEMSPETAARLGLKDGSPVWVETTVGKAQFVIKTTRMRDDVVSVEYGWWHPELPAGQPEVGGLWKSNANILTSGDFETSDPLIGTWRYNGIPCRALPVESDNSQLRNDMGEG